MKEVYEKREQILERIEYDLIADFGNRVQIDEFVEITLEVALSRNSTMKIGRDAEYPIFALEQLAEIYRSIHETPRSAYPSRTPEGAQPEEAPHRIEESVPDLRQHVSESNREESEPAQNFRT